MKRLIPAAALVLVMSAIGIAQNSMTSGLQSAPARKSPLAEYAGAWIATFQGHAWLTIRLNLQGTQLSGTVQHPHNLEFDNSGDVKSVSDERLTGAVENAVIQGDGLFLTVKDTDTQETDRYVMRLTSANTAEVKMVAMPMPPGMPKPQPWKLSRVNPSAVTPVH